MSDLTFEEGAAFTPSSPNGVEHPETETPNTAYTIDLYKGTFTTSTQNTLELRMDTRVSALVMERLSKEGRPEIPMTEVTVVGGRKQWQANPNDPNYLAALKVFNEDSATRILRYVLLTGLKGSPAADWLEEHREYFPSASDRELRYIWLLSLIPPEELDALTDFIIGRIVPTQGGLRDAADSFRRDGERNTD